MPRVITTSTRTTKFIERQAMEFLKSVRSNLLNRMRVKHRDSEALWTDCIAPMSQRSWVRILLEPPENFHVSIIRDNFLNCVIEYEDRYISSIIRQVQTQVSGHRSRSRVSFLPIHKQTKTFIKANLRPN